MDSDKPEIVEAEILDEKGVAVGGNERQMPPRASGFWPGGITAVVFSFLLSVIMVLLAVLLFIPFFILRALGLFKGSFKIHTFKGQK